MILDTKTFICLIGLPGCGKSTVVKELTENNPDNVVCSTDDYFCTGHNDEYVFNPSKLGENHKKCFEKCNYAMSCNVSLIILDNTNILKAHRKPYVDIATKYGYKTIYIYVSTPLETCLERNKVEKRGSKAVPEATIRRMANQLEYEQEAVVRLGDSNFNYEQKLKFA